MIEVSAFRDSNHFSHYHLMIWLDKEFYTIGEKLFQWPLILNELNPIEPGNVVEITANRKCVKTSIQCHQWNRNSGISQRLIT